MSGSPVSEVEILDTLSLLNARLSEPVWLFGGVAVDFLVGRWTRPHGDIDLNTYADSRERLTEELEAIGFRSADKGWLTHWRRDDKPWRLELAFLERTEDGSAVLVIAPDTAVGIPGRYPMLAGYLDPDRYATLDGVRFRVCSPSGEWLARTNAREVFAGRQPEPKIEHDRLLLERLLGPEEVSRLRLSRGER
jgi:Aminoglycoside-2''-adenylyltransferase